MAKPSLARLRRCKGCGLPKPAKRFYKSPSGAPRGRCKDCIRANRRRRVADPSYLGPEKQRSPNRIKAYEARLKRRQIEQNRRRVKRWRKDNPELLWAQEQRALRKERERGYPDAAKRRALAFGAFIEVVDKRSLYNLYEGLCGICGNPIEYAGVTIDHIIPLSRGGKHSYENCQLAHGLCNRRKGNNLPDDVEAA